MTDSDCVACRLRSENDSMMTLRAFAYLSKVLARSSDTLLKRYPAPMLRGALSYPPILRPLSPPPAPRTCPSRFPFLRLDRIWARQ
jgi:hypothetical protein